MGAIPTPATSKNKTPDKGVLFLLQEEHNASMSDTVQQIKDRLSVTDVVSQYVKLERAGTSLRARCPFHAEKSPSFFVSPERGTYHCFGCGVGGDIFSFVEAVEGIDFKGALKILAEKAGVAIEYHSGAKEKTDERDRLFSVMDTATLFYQHHLGDTAKTYLHDRGMNDATIALFRLGYAGNGWDALSAHLRTKKYTDQEIIEAGLAKKNERGGLTDKFRNRIMFPISDTAGRVVAFSGRTFGANASPEAPKYLNSPETPLFHKSRILYGFDKAKLSMRTLNCAVLVEGQMDLLASHQAGWDNTIAVSGTAFTNDHAVLVKRMTDNLIIALDGDEAGIKATARAARAALQTGLNVKVAQLKDGLDPADVIQKEGADAWRTAIRNAKDIITFLLDVSQAHAKSPDIFRRTVEVAVLPFIADVASPIAREQYLHEIATRLGVSESAVVASLDRVPRAPTPSENNSASVSTHTTPTQIVDRAKHAFALLLWQESLPTPMLDVARFAQECEESMGSIRWATLRTITPEEREILRFEGEHLYGKSSGIEMEAKLIVRLLLEERLGGELTESTALLRNAETKGDDAEIERLTAYAVVLTTRIAQLHITV